MRMRAFSPVPQSTRANSVSSASSFSGFSTHPSAPPGSSRGLWILHAQQTTGVRDRIHAPQQGKNLPSVHAVERSIEKDGVRILARRRQGLLHGRGLHHGVAVARQLRRNPRARFRIGVGQHHGAVAGFPAPACRLGAPAERDGRAGRCGTSIRAPDSAPPRCGPSAASQWCGRWPGPSPVPPFCRESEASTCWKRPKMVSSLSAGMPRPDR
jgi:hypothetical protein